MLGKQQPKDLIVVLTAPRGGQDYLKDTLLSLERAGVFAVDADRVICADGADVPLLMGGFARHVLQRRMGIIPEKLGNLRAFMAVFRYAQEHGCDRLLFFEDDIVACKNAVPKMLKTDVPPECAFVSFFDMKELAYGTPRGLHRVPTAGHDGRGYWGSQAILWPKRTIDWLCQREREIVAVPSRASSDCLIGYHLMLSPWPKYAIHVPNLVEHVGIHSAIWSWIPSVNRKSTSFPGEHFDAAGSP